MINFTPAFSGKVCSDSWERKLQALYDLHAGETRRVYSYHAATFSRSYLIDAHKYGIAIPNLLARENDDIDFTIDRELTIVAVGMTYRQKTELLYYYDPDTFSLIATLL